MNLAIQLKDNPFVSWQLAIDIIVSETILQNGIDKFAKYHDVKNYLTIQILIILHGYNDISTIENFNINNDFVSVIPSYNEDGVPTGGVSNTDSLVNLYMLLERYNTFYCIPNKLSPIVLEGITIDDDSTLISSVTSNTLPPQESFIIELTERIAKAVMFVAGRDDKLKKEKIDNIICEHLSSYSIKMSKSCYDKVINVLKEILKDCITPGRPKMVTRKMIEAGIYIGDFYGSTKDLKKTDSKVSKLALPDADKEEIRSILREYVNPNPSGT